MLLLLHCVVLHGWLPCRHACSKLLIKIKGYSLISVKVNGFSCYITLKIKQHRAVLLLAG